MTAPLWVIVLVSALTDFFITAGAGISVAMVSRGDASTPSAAEILLASLLGIVAMMKEVRSQLKLPPVETVANAATAGVGRLVPMIMIALVATLLTASPSAAQQVFPSDQNFPAPHPAQFGSNRNAEVTSLANASAVKTIPAVTSQRVFLYGFTARCSAGTASVTITDGGTTVWSSDSAFVGTSSKGVAWTPTPLTSTAPNQAMVVTLSTCGGGNTGTLDVQADQW